MKKSGPTGQTNFKKRELKLLISAIQKKLPNLNSILKQLGK